MERLHKAVMPNEVIDLIKIKEGGVYADLTFGEGGHSDLFLSQSVAKVVAIDQDSLALARYEEGGKYRLDSRLKRIHGHASELPLLAPEIEFDGILVDLGVSTRQLLEGERGFSLKAEGPLDMRMNPQGDMTLADFLDRVDADELADEIYKNAELRNSRSLARKILERHKAGELKNTLDLASVAGPKHGKAHPATPLFLALRMAVNDELGEVERGIPAWLDCLKPGGRLVIITFHSTEDRLVKKTFQRLAGICTCGGPLCLCPREERVEIITRKPLVPTEDELRDNPRSRSAKVRCIEKAYPQA